MEVGDLVYIKNSEYSPFYERPVKGELGLILEVKHSNFMGTIYFVHTTKGVWRFSDYELELISGSR